MSGIFADLFFCQWDAAFDNSVARVTSTNIMPFFTIQHDAMLQCNHYSIVSLPICLCGTDSLE